MRGEEARNYPPLYHSGGRSIIYRSGSRGRIVVRESSAEYTSSHIVIEEGADVEIIFEGAMPDGTALCDDLFSGLRGRDLALAYVAAIRDGVEPPMTTDAVPSCAS